MLPIPRYFISRPDYVQERRKGSSVIFNGIKALYQKLYNTRGILCRRIFSGRNSNFFYNLSNIRNFLGIKANIEMLYLADELFKQKGKEINLVFGKTIPWQTFDNSKTASSTGLRG